MTNDAAQEVLLPCPFCGNDGTGPIEDALHLSHSEHGWRADSWTAQCDKCSATMGYSDDPDNAIEKWNTRHRLAFAAQRPERAEVEHLVEMARRIMRTAEMSAGIMRDADRTGGWAGAEKTARAFERLAENTDALRSAIAALPPADIAAARIAERERCAKVAHCHSDDRPRRDGMDWNDGYQDGCRGAATAIRALDDQ